MLIGRLSLWAVGNNLLGPISLQRTKKTELLTKYNFYRLRTDTKFICSQHLLPLARKPSNRGERLSKPLRRGTLKLCRNHLPQQPMESLWTWGIQHRMSTTSVPSILLFENYFYKYNVCTHFIISICAKRFTKMNDVFYSTYLEP